MFIFIIFYDLMSKQSSDFSSSKEHFFFHLFLQWLEAREYSTWFAGAHCFDWLWTLQGKHRAQWHNLHLLWHTWGTSSPQSAITAHHPDVLFPWVRHVGFRMGLVISDCGEDLWDTKSLLMRREWLSSLLLVLKVLASSWQLRYCWDSASCCHSEMGGLQ